MSEGATSATSKPTIENGINRIYEASNFAKSLEERLHNICDTLEIAPPTPMPTGSILGPTSEMARPHCLVPAIHEAVAELTRTHHNIDNLLQRLNSAIGGK